MHRDLKIIGDRIEFMGYHVGNLCEVPDTVRKEFIFKMDEAACSLPNPVEIAEDAKVV